MTEGIWTLHKKSTKMKGKNMAIIGYIRVSSSKQTLDHQEFEIKKFATAQNIQINRWVEEKISSRKALNKRKLGQLLEELKGGDNFKKTSNFEPCTIGLLCKREKALFFNN